MEVDELKEREAKRRNAEKKKGNSSDTQSGATGSEGLKRLFGFLLFADEEQ